MAPELCFVVDGPTQEASSPSITKSSDIYSFALLVLEILTSEPPKGRPSRSIVTAKTLDELRPKRADYDEIQVPEGTWLVLNLFWTFEPHLHPTITEVFRALSTDTAGTSGLVELPDADERPPPDVPQRDAQAPGGGSGGAGGPAAPAQMLNAANSVPGGVKAECSNCGATHTPLWRRGLNDELNCNACGLYCKLQKRPRPRTMRNTGGGEGRGQPVRAEAVEVMAQCYKCHTTATPIWRKDDAGKTVCNACGLYYKLHGSTRQTSMKSDVIRKRSRHEAHPDGASSNHASPAPSSPTSSSASAGRASPSYNEQYSDVLPFARVEVSEIGPARASKRRRLSVDSASEPPSSTESSGLHADEYMGASSQFSMGFPFSCFSNNDGSAQNNNGNNGGRDSGDGSGDSGGLHGDGGENAFWQMLFRQGEGANANNSPDGFLLPLMHYLHSPMAHPNYYFGPQAGHNSGGLHPPRRSNNDGDDA